MLAFIEKIEYNFLGDEMKNQNNICKFVDNSKSGSISTKNFVFEKKTVTRSILPQDNCMYLVTNGKGILKMENFEHPIVAGNIFFTFSHVPYSIGDGDDLNYMYITFEGERSSELFFRFGITPQSAVFDGHEGILAFWQNAIVKANEKNLDLISESVLLYTFGEMTVSEKVPENQLIGRILNYIENNFSDCELNLTTLADSLGYNSKYISRVFKNAIGIPFSQYLTNTRIQNAIFLFEQGVTAIKNVSLLSGYKDPFYFSNVFKGVVGMSPSEYILKIQR